MANNSLHLSFVAPSALLLLAIAMLSVIGVAQAASLKQSTAATQTPWELTDALSAMGRIRGFNGTWITDDEFYYTATDKSIHKYNAATNTDSIFVTKDFLELYTRSTFTLSPDNTKILVRFDVEEIFRHSFIARYDVFDIATKTAISINNGVKLQFCTWSPIKDRLSYVYENNVYIHYGEGAESQITVDGVDGVVYNGIPDWVYEEEVLGTGSAMWWAPNGNHLAVGLFDDTDVQTFKYMIYGEAEEAIYQYPREVDLKYPKAGTENPVVAMRIFDLTDSVPTSVKITAPIDIVTKDHILQNVVWVDAESFIIIWMNRRQNLATIQQCSVNGNCREVKRIEEPEGWVTMGTPQCLKSGLACVFTYWIGNWMQVWKLNLKDGQNDWSSRGDFTVLRVYGYDEDQDDLYYQATLNGEAAIYHVFKDNECLTCYLRDVDGAECRSASASFSKDFSYYAMVCNGPNPSYTKIIETETNQEVKMWEPNTEARQYFDTKLRSTVEFMNVTLADGSMGMVKLDLPPNMDRTKKYPMIVNVYGGPNSVRVTSSFAVGFAAYMTTYRDVIYAQIDGHGTGNKGKSMLFSVNNNLGEHEVADQIYVAKYLQDTLGYVDAERTGIWGWSYGGYVSAKTLATDTDRVFQCGVAVAPVTSWLYYDSIYTERYMGLPTPTDNLDKYRESSVLETIDNFRSHDFLLIHGSGDDNVHYQQSLMLAKVLQHNDIQFEQMTYTDENHSIGNFLTHLYNTIDHFWVNCLNLDVEGDSHLV